MKFGDSDDRALEKSGKTFDPDLEKSGSESLEMGDREEGESFRFLGKSGEREDGESRNGAGICSFSRSLKTEKILRLN